MLTLKQVKAALSKKQADLDMMDDELSMMPEMAPDAPMDSPTSPEFNLLSQKREELESEIQQMREGVQLISEWEKFKGGQWSEDIKRMLGEIDVEITNIAGGEPEPAGDLLGGPVAPDLGMTDPMAPPPIDDMGTDPMSAPPAEPLPTDDLSGGLAAEPPMDEAAPEDSLTDAPAADVPPPADDAPPMAPMASAKSPVSKKNSYQAPDKKGVSATSNMKKDGSTMANQTDKPSIKEKLAEVKSKREAIKKEAQARVAAAWTIAKTLLPSAPAEKMKEAAANFLQMSTPVLNAMLRQTAKNAHYTKLAEKFESVHKKTLNDLMEEPSVLKSEQSSVASELKGEAKSAAVEPKVADDRKEAGPQPEKYDDGRDGSEPKAMDAGKAAERPANTINKSEGGDKVAAKAAVAPKTACSCEGDCKCKSAAKCDDCTDSKKCSKHASVEPEVKEAAKEDVKEAAKEDDKKAAAKTAGPMDGIVDAPPAEGMDAPPAEMDAPIDEAPMEDAPPDMPMDDAAPADNANEIAGDEKQMIVEEKITEIEDAVHVLEKELLEETQELDYDQIFNEEQMEDKVSSLANEGDEHTAGNGEEFFTPSASESMEASLDEPQMASMEDFFSLQGSDSDPMAHLIASDIHTAAEVAGMTVIPSSTGEAAKKFESEAATGESRDNESDHDGDLFAEAIENVSPEDGGFKRTKQDETNELQTPKAASKTASTKSVAPVIKKLKPVVAAEKKPVDIASALFGNDEF